MRARAAVTTQVSSKLDALAYFFAPLLPESLVIAKECSLATAASYPIENKGCAYGTFAQKPDMECTAHWAVQTVHGG